MNIITEIQAMRKESRTFTDIAKNFNARGLTTPQGLSFTAQRVQSTLSNAQQRTKSQPKQVAHKQTHTVVETVATTPISHDSNFAGLLGDIQQLAATPISDETFGRLVRKLLKH